MPAYKNEKKTRQYTNEFKARAVKLIHRLKGSISALLLFSHLCLHLEYWR